MTSPERYSPVVALDVDGVLRIPEPRPGEGTETIAAEIKHSSTRAMNGGPGTGCAATSSRTTST